MTTKDKKTKPLLEGFTSTFDLFGSGFMPRKHNVHPIRASWHNVGVSFSKGFSRFKNEYESEGNFDFEKKFALNGKK